MPKNKDKSGKRSLESPILPLYPNDSNPERNRPNQSQAKEKKTGRGRIRAAVLIAVHLLILLHVSHYWMTGRSVSPVEPSEAMYTIELGQLNAGAIFFGVAILSTAIFGRFFCGWGCHLVALQDLCGYLLQRVGIRPKPLRSRLLTLIPFVLAFYMFCWPTLKRLLAGNQHPGFSNHLMTNSFWETFPGISVALLTFVVCGGLIVYLLGNKGFCTYGCPYGAIFSIADRVAPGRIRVTDDCNSCGQCTAHCTSNVMVHAEVRDFGLITDPGCMKCMDCISVCPNQALYFGLSDRTKSSDKKHPAKPRQKKSYDFSIAEELFGLAVAAVTVFALRSLYDITPLLLAVGLGAITAFLAIKFLHLFRKRDLRLQRIQLKRNHRLTKNGRWAIALLSLWFVFLAHSSFVQFHRYQGRAQLRQITASWTALLDGVAQDSFTDKDRGMAAIAEDRFKTCDRLGLLGTYEVKRALAITSLMHDNEKDAEKYLRESYNLNPEAMKEMIAEFFVSRGRTQEASDFFEGTEAANRN